MAKENTKQAKMHFRTSLTLNLLIKNMDNTDGRMQLNIQHDQLDPYIGHSYTAEDLDGILYDRFYIENTGFCQGDS